MLIHSTNSIGCHTYSTFRTSRSDRFFRIFPNYSFSYLFQSTYDLILYKYIVNYMGVHVVMWGLSIYATVALLKRLSINHSSLLWGLWYPSNMTVIAKGFHWDHPRSSSKSSLLMNWPKQHEKQGCREPCCPSPYIVASSYFYLCIAINENLATENCPILLYEA